MAGRLGIVLAGSCNLDSWCVACQEAPAWGGPQVREQMRAFGSQVRKIDAELSMSFSFTEQNSTGDKSWRAFAEVLDVILRTLKR